MRQKPIDRYIVDFYCSKLKLVIEIDGDSHIGKEQEDKERQSEIEKLGITFLRFEDLEVKKNLDGLLILIRNYIGEFEAKKNKDNPLAPFNKGDSNPIRRIN